MSKFHEIVGFAMAMEATMEFNQEQWKKEILEKWEQTKKMPRKMKKRVRKELQIDWAFASWSPFDDMNF